MKTDTTADPWSYPPWYRQIWPWILLAIPGTSIVLGLSLLFLSLNTNNSLVVDDYYREGKAINLRIERDRLATRLALAAVLSDASETLSVDLQSDELAYRKAWPRSLLLRWVHVTDEQRDGQAILHHTGAGRYVAGQQSLPEEGVWRLHLEPTEQAAWRLVSTTVALDGTPVRWQARSLP